MVEINVTQKETFKKVFAHLTSPCNSIFIGGGAVADLLRAGDIDVWFGKKRAKEAINFFKSFHHRSTSTYSMEYAANGAKLYGSVWDPDIASGKIIQVLTLNVDTPEEAINAWDISTHMWGYTSRGRLVKGEKATDVTVPPQVINSSEGAWGRYIKICKRYGWPVDEKVLKGMDDQSWPTPMAAPYPQTVAAQESAMKAYMKETLAKQNSKHWNILKKPMFTTNNLESKYLQPNFIYEGEDVKAEGDYLDDPPF